jgi:hypothetical protein
MIVRIIPSTKVHLTSIITARSRLGGDSANCSPALPHRAQCTIGFFAAGMTVMSGRALTANQ